MHDVLYLQVWGRVATEIAQTLVSVQLPSAVHNCTACVWTEPKKKTFQNEEMPFRIVDNTENVTFQFETSFKVKNFVLRGYLSF